MNCGSPPDQKLPGRSLRCALTLLLLGCVFKADLAAQAFPAAKQHAAATDVTGSLFSYTVAKGDSLTLIGARFGAAISTIAELNGLNPSAVLRTGRTLQIDNRHLVPSALEEGILLNVPQRMLFIFKSGRLAGAYPITVGRPNWQTPIGSFHVLERQRDKTWEVPLSIQEEMRREGQVVRQEVLPGPENPLGEYWIRISPSCGIHGTNAPSSIYSATSHGCVRLQPSAIAEVYPLSAIGMPVQSIYQPLLFAKIGDTCYLEVNRDVYGMDPPSLEPIEAWATAVGLTQAIDWELVRRELQEKRGIARPICAVKPR
jgi:L,D-transpeptidase ErfK/SrfK